MFFFSLILMFFFFFFFFFDDIGSKFHKNLPYNLPIYHFKLEQILETAMLGPEVQNQNLQFR